MISGIIFDLDGTLITSEELVYQSYRRAYRHFTGREPDAEMLRSAIVQMGAAQEDDILSIFRETMGLSATQDEIYRTYLRFYDEQGFACIGFTPGAERLVRHLHAHKVPMGIASNTRRDRFAVKVAHLHHVIGLIPHTVMYDEVENAKPYPEMMHEAARRMNVDGASCLVIDDSPKGIAAARAAGMKCIGLTFRIRPEEMPGADAYLPGLAAFDPESWGLPKFE